MVPWISTYQHDQWEAHATAIRRRRLLTLTLICITALALHGLGQASNTHGGACIESSRGCVTTERTHP